MKRTLTEAGVRLVALRPPQALRHLEYEARPRRTKVPDDDEPDEIPGLAGGHEEASALRAEALHRRIARGRAVAVLDDGDLTHMATKGDQPHIIAWLSALAGGSVLNPEPKELTIARQYGSAEEYAAALNPYGSWRASDPPQLRERAEQEQRRLVEKWNMWRQLGLIGERAK